MQAFSTVSKVNNVMEKIKVSVVIIAKDADKKIGPCLKSVQWSDDVIVVDGFSADKTVSMAESSGARVIQHKFTCSFADDRNVGLDNARNDWVLQLDADDVVTDTFVARLKAALARDEGIVIYKFRRKNFFLNHPMDHGGFHHYIPNLVDRRAVRYAGSVHEVPVYEGRIGTIDADVEHYPFDSVGQFVERHNRYSGIAAREEYNRNPALSEKYVKSQMVWKTLKLFWKSYVKKQGYKEGVYGLIFAGLFAMVNFLKWAKYWEMSKNKKD
jgi:glycosyltransferase involved in cell wall biosynthesis